MRKPGPGPVSREPQVSAIASAARQEILDVLAITGPAAAIDLARILGRPADGLYYHLRVLQRVGLVAPAGARVRGGRREVLYRTAHGVTTLRHDPSPRGNTPGVVAIVSSMLRLGIRDFRRAAADRHVRTEGPRRELWGLRVTGWLSPPRLAAVNRRINVLKTMVSRPRPGARLFGITILLTPLDHRARRSRRPRPTPASRRLR